MRKRIRTVGPIVALVVAAIIAAAIALRGQPEVMPLAGLSAPRWLERIYNRMPGNVPQMDDTDKMAVSLYGENSAAGDTSVLLTSGGRVLVALGGSEAESDALAVRSFTLALNSDDTSGRLVVVPVLYNGATWDRTRNNHEVTVLAVSARVTSTNSSAVINYNHSGMALFVDLSARAGTTTLTPTIQIQEPISSTWVSIWTAAAPINSSDTTVVYSFHPGNPGTDAASLYTEEVEIVLPRTWRMSMEHLDTDSVTYQVSASMVP